MAKRLRWKRLPDEQAVQDTVLGHVPAGSSADQVRAFAAEQRLACHDLANGDIFCRAPARARWPVSGAWLITFRLVDGNVDGVSIRLAFTGS
jgi:hypothetical protein